MTVAIACAVAIAVIAYVLGVRDSDLPAPEPESPFTHLEERKAAIYENLRDLQFEFRVGKLSEADYQSTKRDLQKELAAVLAEFDRVKAGAQPMAAKAAAPAAAPKPAANQCSTCGATFKEDLKFCGECGKPMQGVRA